MTDRPDYPDFRAPSPDEVARLIAEARRLRGVALRDALFRAFAWVRSAAARALSGRAEAA